MISPRSLQAFLATIVIDAAIACGMALEDVYWGDGDDE